MSFTLILGCMFSGKTSELIARYDSYTLAGKSCLMIKYIGDNRYSSTDVITHNGIKVTAYKCENLWELECNNVLNTYDIICIDEVQFYSDAHIYCDKWATDGKIVIASGLNGTSERKPFKIISKLVPKADNIIFKTAICRESGCDASFSDSKVVKTEEKLIGGAETYRAVDRKTYFSSGSRLKKYYAKLYTKINKIHKKN